MKPSVYIETTITSYLAARPNNDMRAMANKNATQEWWDCTHIANAIMRPKLEMVCRKLGYEPPVICTPLELMEV
jgi:L-rhamnose mutarotase